MGINKLDFLTLIVALSAYVATVRFAVITQLGRKEEKTANPNQSEKERKADEAKDAKERDRRAWSKFFLLSLLFADIPLVIAGLFLVADLFLKDFPDKETAALHYPRAQGLFVFAIVVLALHHAYSGCLSIYKFLTTK